MPREEAALFLPTEVAFDGEPFVGNREESCASVGEVPAKDPDENIGDQIYDKCVLNRQGKSGATVIDLD